MTRRDAYLLTWGIAYLGLGVFLVELRGSNTLWVFYFGIAGLVAIAGAVSRPAWVDRLGFILLAMTAAARAAWFIYDYLETQLFGDLFGVLVWSAVAVAQVIVSGWPEYRVEIRTLGDRETGGLD